MVDFAVVADKVAEALNENDSETLRSLMAPTLRSRHSNRGER